MKRVRMDQLHNRDRHIADVTLGDQVHRLDYAVVAQHLPADVLLMLVRDGDDLALWARGPRQSVENARHFFLGWRSCLRNANGCNQE